MSTTKDPSRQSGAFLRFFQSASLASRAAPVSLKFESLAAAQAARAELNTYRAQLRKAESDHYNTIKDVTLRIAMADDGAAILAHVKENSPLKKALESAGFATEDEDLGEGYLDDLLKEGPN